MTCPFFIMAENLIHIAVPGTPRKLFTYRANPEIIERLEPGMRLKVPFGKRNTIGFFIEITGRKPPSGLKNISSLVDTRPLFDEGMFRFLKWMSEYYFCNIADTLKMALPPELRKGKTSRFLITKEPEHIEELDKLSPYARTKLCSQSAFSVREINHIKKNYIDDFNYLTANDIIKEEWADPREKIKGTLLGYRFVKAIEGIPDDIQTGRVYSRSELRACGLSQYRIGKLLDEGIIVPEYGNPESLDFIKARPDVSELVPNEEQQQAINRVLENLNNFNPMLLYGITGSGKTLVYCHIVRKLLEQDKSSLILVPEIALAGTLLGYFRSFFGDRVALMHSALRPKERLLIWQKIRSGEYKIVIGARSAVFSQMKNPGIIIVDEEHDESYKQDDPAPRFQARDCAVMRAKLSDIPIVLGSATPSLESFHNALNGRYELLRLTRRPERTDMPLIRLIDLKDERLSADALFFTPLLKSKIDDAIGQGNQVILYFNRRGFSPRIKCTGCGHTPECPHCGISLTYHRAGDKLMCHFCGYADPGYNACEKCQSRELIYIGTGTQKIEDKIAELFKPARAVRLDSDSAAGREKAHRILADFAEQKFNMLIGTQMVTKGIDFPKVSLVGVLMADLGLDIPDFRASEKLFAKLIQVSGRSGRGIIPGEVVIQTFNPYLDLIDDAARQDYESFYHREIKSREELKYPPFAHLINFRLSTRKEEDLQKTILEFRDRLALRLDKEKVTVHLLGPAPCPIYRLRGAYRRHLLVKTGQIRSFLKVLSTWENEDSNFGLPSRIKAIVDIDPYDMM